MASFASDNKFTKQIINSNSQFFNDQPISNFEKIATDHGFTKNQGNKTIGSFRVTNENKFLVYLVEENESSKLNNLVLYRYIPTTNWDIPTESQINEISRWISGKDRSKPSFLEDKGKLSQGNNFRVKLTDGSTKYKVFILFPGDVLLSTSRQREDRVSVRFIWYEKVFVDDEEVFLSCSSSDQLWMSNLVKYEQESFQVSRCTIGGKNFTLFPNVNDSSKTPLRFKEQQTGQSKLMYLPRVTSGKETVPVYQKLINGNITNFQALVGPTDGERIFILDHDPEYLIPTYVRDYEDFFATKIAFRLLKKNQDGTYRILLDHRFISILHPRLKVYLKLVVKSTGVTQYLLFDRTSFCLMSIRLKVNPEIFGKLNPRLHELYVVFGSREEQILKPETNAENIFYPIQSIALVNDKLERESSDYGIISDKYALSVYDTENVGNDSSVNLGSLSVDPGKLELTLSTEESSESEGRYRRAKQYLGYWEIRDSKMILNVNYDNPIITTNTDLGILNENTGSIAYGCAQNCSGSCGGGCSGTCSGGCSGSCSGCSGSCSGSCSGCSGSCSGCSGSCSGSCSGCSGKSCSFIGQSAVTNMTESEIIEDIDSFLSFKIKAVK